MLKFGASLQIFKPDYGTHNFLHSVVCFVQFCRLEQGRLILNMEMCGIYEFLTQKIIFLSKTQPRPDKTS